MSNIEFSLQTTIPRESVFNDRIQYFVKTGIIIRINNKIQARVWTNLFRFK